MHYILKHIYSKAAINNGLLERIDKCSCDAVGGFQTDLTYLIAAALAELATKDPCS
jgi:hypothetical protein